VEPLRAPPLFNELPQLSIRPYKGTQVMDLEDLDVGIYACRKAEHEHTGLSLGRKDYIGV